MRASMRHININVGSGYEFTIWAGDIYGKAVEIFMTPPNVVNEIAYYEAWVNGIFVENIKEIDCIINLIPETFYSIYLIPVDIYGTKYGSSNTISITTPVWQTYLFDNFTQIVGVYSLKKLTSASNKALKLQRSSDNVQTDLYFDASGFISMASLVTGGATLSTWIGANTARIMTIYDQKNINDLNYNSDINRGYGNLVESGVLQIVNSCPVIKIYKGIGTTTTVGFSFYKNAFNGSIATDVISDATMFTVNKNEENLSTTNYDLCGFTNSVNDYATDKKKWLLKTDNTQRFYGTFISGVVIRQINNIRTDIKNGYLYSGYLNGALNIPIESYRDATNTSAYVYGINHQNSNNFISYQKILLNAVALTNMRRIRRLVEKEINIELNNYVVLS